MAQKTISALAETIRSISGSTRALACSNRRPRRLVAERLLLPNGYIDCPK
jgi:hypothetical protein